MLITNVEIVDAHGRKFGNVLIQDGVIKDTDYKGETAQEERIDGNGLTLMPSFIDLHCHLRDPGYEYKEDMESGMKAALKGGYTHLAAMANTKPIMDTIELIHKNLEKSKNLDLCDLTQIAAVTKNFGRELVDFEGLTKGTKVFSNDGVNVDAIEIMKEALQASRKLGFLIAAHCEPEVETVARDLQLLEENGGNLHICHVSEGKALELIKNAKSKGLKMTCEVAPHHIFAREVEYRVNPSIPREEDQKALIQAIKEGVIDICATDHAPHSKEDKEKGSPGISNIEVAFSMYWKVYSDNKIALERLSEMMSLTPARLLGLNCGEIVVGREANLVLVDREKEHLLDVNDFVSRSNNNPFHNEPLKGEVLITIKRGVIKYDHR